MKGTCIHFTAANKCFLFSGTGSWDLCKNHLVNYIWINIKHEPDVLIRATVVNMYHIQSFSAPLCCLSVVLGVLCVIDMCPILHYVVHQNYWGQYVSYSGVQFFTFIYILSQRCCLLLYATKVKLYASHWMNIVCSKITLNLYQVFIRIIQDFFSRHYLFI